MTMTGSLQATRRTAACLLGCLSLIFLGCGGGSSSDPQPPPATCGAAPSVPTGLAASGLTSTGVVLTWNAASADAACVVQYHVFRDGTEVAQVTSPTTSITGLTAGTTYSFAVAAFDAAGVSAQSSALAVTTPAVPVNTGMEIRTWVPPYNQSTWMAALTADTGGPYNPKNTLTSVAAQYYQIKTDGTVFLQSGVSASDITWVANYCATNHKKFLICVTDWNVALATPDWDWTLATAAFSGNKTALITSLMAMVASTGADGVDIDFEGLVDMNASRTAFASFLNDLGTQLHAAGKILTVAVYPYIWNAPNMGIIGDWAGHVDCVESMGYENLFGGATASTPGVWGTYQWQQDTALAAGYKNHQFAEGMPGYKATWGSGGLGTSVLNHVQELQSRTYTTKPTSVCIWDAQFTGSGWLSAEVWAGLHAIQVTPHE